MLTEDILVQLAYNKLDAGILSTPVKSKNVAFLPLFYEDFYLYVSEKHHLFKTEIIAQREVDTEQLWYLTEGNCFQNQVNSVCSIPSFETSKGSFRYISSSIESLKRIVETQGGLTFIPELATLNVASEFEDLIKPIEAPAPYREISLAYLKTSGVKKLVKAFVDVIIESLPKRMQVKPTTLPLDTKL